MPQNILLCDDEVHILRAAEFKLRRAGFDVHCASDGQEAWEAIGRQIPDIVITDYQMPRMNGLELCGRLRSDPRTQHLPIILLTAKGFELKAEEVAAQYGVAELVAKPFSPRELLAITERLLRAANDLSAEDALEQPTEAR